MKIQKITTGAKNSVYDTVKLKPVFPPKNDIAQKAAIPVTFNKHSLNESDKIIQNMTQDMLVLRKAEQIIKKSMENFPRIV